MVIDIVNFSITLSGAGGYYMSELLNHPFRGAGGKRAGAPIFLIGFMGSGKTYQARRLSQQFHLPWYDLDRMIMDKSGMSISEIFATKGEEYFRKTESELLKSTDTSIPAIISAGGGTPCFFNNMQWMNENGTTIYLKANNDTVYERLKFNKHKRPLIAEMSDPELKHFIKTKIEERELYYNQSKWILDDADIPFDWFEQNILNNDK